MPRLSLRQCLQIAKLEKVEDQLQVMKECAEDGLAGKALEAQVKSMLNPAVSSAAKPPKVGKPFQFTWKDEKLMIKAVYDPRMDFAEFDTEFGTEFFRFVQSHPAPAKEAAQEEVAPPPPTSDAVTLSGGGGVARAA